MVNPNDDSLLLLEEAAANSLAFCFELHSELVTCMALATSVIYSTTALYNSDLTSFSIYLVLLTYQFLAILTFQNSDYKT